MLAGVSPLDSAAIWTGAVLLQGFSFKNLGGRPEQVPPKKETTLKLDLEAPKGDHLFT